MIKRLLKWLMCCKNSAEELIEEVEEIGEYEEKYKNKIYK